jgi:putative membrane protein
MLKQSVITLAIAAALMTACKAGDVNTNAGPNPRDSATAGVATSGAASSPASQTPGLSAQDQQFVQKAAEGGRQEVELGRLAQQHGASDVVKRLGQRIADDHERTNREFGSLLGAEIARAAAAYENSERARLEKMSGKAFDRRYVELMIEDHQKDIAEFEGAMHSTSRTVQNFVEKTLPTLREHLVQAREAEAALGK